MLSSRFAVLSTAIQLFGVLSSVCGISAHVLPSFEYSSFTVSSLFPSLAEPEIVIVPFTSYKSAVPTFVLEPGLVNDFISTDGGVSSTVIWKSV